MNLDKARALADKIATHLGNNGHHKDALELRALAAMLGKTDTETSEAAKQMAIQCNVKWYGDMLVRELAQNDWWELLSELRGAVTNDVQSPTDRRSRRRAGQ
jgi:hypothetical protein